MRIELGSEVDEQMIKAAKDKHEKMVMEESNSRKTQIPTKEPKHIKKTYATISGGKHKESKKH